MQSYVKFVGANTSNAQGGVGGAFKSLARIGILVLSLIIGAAVFLFTASAALVLVLAIAVLGLFAFVYFWIRAKVFKKPFGGQAYQDMRKAARAQKAAMQGQFMDMPSETDMQGDVLDAHKTPDGWSVDE